MTPTPPEGFVYEDHVDVPVSERGPYRATTYRHPVTLQRWGLLEELMWYRGRLLTFEEMMTASMVEAEVWLARRAAYRALPWWKKLFTKVPA